MKIELTGPIVDVQPLYEVLGVMTHQLTPLHVRAFARAKLGDEIQSLRTTIAFLEAQLANFDKVIAP